MQVPRRSSIHASLQHFQSRAVIALAVAASFGCAAVYPEIATPLRDAPHGRELSPPAPDDMYYIEFKSAEIPELTRDGRKWDKIGGDAPDPFAKILVDDRELVRTPVQANTLTPSWPDQKRRNYRVAPGAQIRIEVWDSNPINNHPICVKKLSSLSGEADEHGEVALVCDSGARVTLRVEAARPKVGLGLFYELRTRDIFVTRVIADSPAGRAGLEGGDQIVKIMGQDTRDMDGGKAKSLVNANATMGVTLTIKKKANGDVADVVLKEGPIYATGSEGVKL